MTQLYKFGRIGFAGVLVFGLFVYLKCYRETTIFKTLFFITSVFFFYPVFISNNENTGFLSYAMAHGLQYIIFMTVVSVNAKGAYRRSVGYRNVWKLLMFLLVLGFVFWRVSDLKLLSVISSSAAFMKFVDFLIGCVLGATMSHFVVDASAWKLSKAAQRAYISRRFDFIFAKKIEAGH